MAARRRTRSFETDHSFHKEIDSTPGGHGGPPLQYVPQSQLIIYSMNLTHSARMFGDALLALAYPQACVICGRSVEQRRFGVACESCWQGTLIFTDDDEICLKCGSPGPPACSRCEVLAFTAARAVGMYK